VGSAERRDGAPATNGGGGVAGGPRACMGSVGSTKHGRWQLSRVRGGRSRERSRGIENGRLPVRWSMTMEEKWWGASTGPGASPSSHGSTRGGPWPPGHVLPHQRWTWHRWPCDTVVRSGWGWVRWVQQGEAEVVVCSVWPITNNLLRTTSWA
jgi:hypothetical protein